MPLIDELRYYTNLSHAYAWKAMKPGKVMDEPTLVQAFLSKQIIPKIRGILRNQLVPGARTLTRGIFTHKTPWVKMKGAAAACEIADLMLVHKHFYPFKLQPQGNALLLQAKTSDIPHTGALTKTGDVTQFHLYEKWDEFKGTKRIGNGPFPGSPNTPWDFRSGGMRSASDASAYLTIFDTQAFEMLPLVPPQAYLWESQLGLAVGTTFNSGMYPSDCVWSTGSNPPLGAAPAAGVGCGTDFGTTFCDFLKGAVGRPFVSGAADHWSIFVERMLAASAQKSYTYACHQMEITAGLRGRNLGYAAALSHCFCDVYDTLRDGFPHENLREAFQFADALTESFRRNQDGDHPPSDGDEWSRIIPSGHVPILLILTMGPDKPFGI